MQLTNFFSKVAFVLGVGVMGAAVSSAVRIVRLNSEADAYKKTSIEAADLGNEAAHAYNTAMGSHARREAKDAAGDLPYLSGIGGALCLLSRVGKRQL